ncbi:MAG TPA: glyceraldehyde 3-phosphate dehydrogenase NAD-binding domain-containing protein [Thermoanaerobaculia bacterium]|nr:glyceraldehyde 3-phosphate dehydrogenase NAD-binding domain-containing protein [Thermoanaerobaculia bacterium]
MADGPLKIGLMGFGRMGRSLFRILGETRDLSVAAIADPADHAALVYLLRFDTLLGRYPGAVELSEDGWLYAGGRRMKMLAARDPGDVDWAEVGVHTVIDASAHFPKRESIEKHLARGARRVILCVPSADPPDITVVMGVNDDQLRSEHRIVSNASCTAHAAAPVLEVLGEAFGLERVFLTSVHAYTNQQRLADVPAEDPRRGRAAAENIIPQETNAGEVITALEPALAGKLTAHSINVPVANGSLVDLVCWHREPVDVAAINGILRSAAGSKRWRGILAYEDDPIVSSDVRQSTCSSTFDGPATMTLGDRVSKTIAWFDNTWGYAHRVVDLVRRFREIDEKEAA